ncbi:MAG TPA: hypothetical protein VLM76_09395 [Patescibacteria group bacterium]|nr:hypothetical protein [Patescibacteria group bacterium]
MVTRRFTVYLPQVALDRLRDLAEREMRDTRAQATFLILDGLERAGFYERMPPRPPERETPR